MAEAISTPRLGGRYKVPPERIRDGDLALCRCSLDHAQATFAAASASLPELKAWMTWAADGYPLQSVEKFIRDTSEDWDEGTAYSYVLLFRDEVVGSLGLMNPIIGTDGMAIWYWLATPMTGRGLASRAANLLAQAAFDAGAELVQIGHAPGNYRSSAIPRRLGYRSIGEAPFNGNSVQVVWQLDRACGKDP